MQAVGNSAVGTGTARTQSTLSPPPQCPLHLPCSLSFFSSPRNAASRDQPPGIGCQPSSLLNDSTLTAGTGHAIPPHFPISTANMARHGGDVRSLVQEDPTCRRATKTVCHNYWTHLLQLLKPSSLESMLHNKRSL